MIISVPSTRWFFSGEELSSDAYARTGRRLAYTPSAWRILRSPFSGRFSGGALSNSGSPTAPISVASAPAASRAVSDLVGVHTQRLANLEESLFRPLFRRRIIELRQPDRAHQRGIRARCQPRRFLGKWRPRLVDRPAAP